MRVRGGWTVAALLVVGLAVPACTSSSTEEETGSEPPPVSVERTEGSDVARVTLSEDAARRLDVQTTAVRSAGGGGRKSMTTIPYSAVLYDPNGETWTYTSPERLVFVRSAIRVDRIEGDVAILVSGPPVGTQVVTVAASELLGAEYGVGGE